LEILYKALKPESLDKEISGDFVRMQIEEEKLTIEINHKSLSRIRALMNSYIFWIYTILSTLEKLGEIGG